MLRDTLPTEKSRTLRTACDSFPKYMIGTALMG